jgi:hypothetical protein
LDLIHGLLMLAVAGDYVVMLSSIKMQKHGCALVGICGGDTFSNKSQYGGT